MSTECSISGCNKAAACRTWCKMHYRRWYRHGDPNTAIASQGPASDRFWPKVDKAGAGGCWNWTGSLTRGYGVLNVGKGRYAYAHRLAYEWLVGPIPEGLQLDHLCRNPACVNPDHLEPVPGVENSRRATRIGHHSNAPQTCKRGHDWSVTPPYIALRAGGRVSRRCRVCQSEQDKARRLGGAA